ncbi:CLUMA_CG011305, isoform A [Clunio marinus]|uniref:CLUMA_CG011305, isoform A n=1 Tax=Clunio marinus TaxID=568069 RepID=A0A1J1IEF2_9DIPT|nr:CLUMA_CG011305, isoform A [Clunio marinus]
MQQLIGEKSHFYWHIYHFKAQEVQSHEEFSKAQKFLDDDEDDAQQCWLALIIREQQQQQRQNMSFNVSRVVSNEIAISNKKASPKIMGTKRC